MVVLGGLALTGKGSQQPREDRARADAGEIPADILPLLPLGGEGPRHGGGLHDADHGDDEYQRKQAAQPVVAREQGQRQAWQMRRERPHQHHAVILQMKQGNGEAGAGQGDEGPGNARADAGRPQGHDQHRETEGERIGIGVADPADDMDQPL